MCGLSRADGIGQEMIAAAATVGEIITIDGGDVSFRLICFPSGAKVSNLLRNLPQLAPARSAVERRRCACHARSGVAARGTAFNRSTHLRDTPPVNAFPLPA